MYFFKMTILKISFKNKKLSIKKLSTNYATSCNTDMEFSKIDKIVQNIRDFAKRSSHL